MEKSEPPKPIEKRYYRVGKRIFQFGLAVSAGFYLTKLWYEGKRKESYNNEKKFSLPQPLQSFLKTEIIKVFRDDIVRAESVDVLESIFRDEMILNRVNDALASSIQSLKVQEAFRNTGLSLLKEVFYDDEFQTELAQLLKRLSKDAASTLLMNEFLRRTTMDQDVQNSVREIFKNIILDEKFNIFLEKQFSQILKNIFIDEELEDAIQAFAIKFYEGITAEVHHRNPFDRNLFFDIEPKNKN